MMNTTTGTVQKILAKPAGNKGGTSYNFVVQVNGQDTWFGHGFAPTKFKEGDTITFSWKENGNFKNVEVSTVRIEAGGAPAPQQQQGAPAAQSGPVRTNSTQLAIQYQASRNAAIHLLEVIVNAGAVSLPAKKSDQFDAMLALIDDMTNTFHTKTDKVVENGGLVLEELEIAVSNRDFE